MPNAHFAATRAVLESSDHYRARRLARLLTELAEDVGALPGPARKHLAADADLARRHADALKPPRGGKR